MPHIFAGAQFIAPIYYFGVDDPTEEDIARDEAPFRVCLLDEGDILPTWSSLDRYQDFFRIYRGGDNLILPFPWEPNAFDLANIAGALQQAGVDYLIVDPEATSAGRWANPREAMTIRYFRRLTEEIFPGLEELFAEATAELGHEPRNHEEFEWVRRRCATRIEEVFKDAHARLRGREAEDEYWCCKQVARCGGSQHGNHRGGLDEVTEGVGSAPSDPTPVQVPDPTLPETKSRWDNLYGKGG